MSKITLLVEEARAERSLKNLRKLGVLHVKPIPNPPSADLAAIDSRIEQIRKALALLGDASDVRQKHKGDAADLVEEIIRDGKALEIQTEKQRELSAALNWYENWSRVSLEQLEALKREGYYLTLYQLSHADWQELREAPDLFELNSDKSSVQVALISDNPEKKLNFRTVTLPELPVDVLETQLRENAFLLKQSQKQLEDARSYADLIKSYLEQLKKEQRFAQVRNGLGLEENIAYLQGYVPSETAPLIEEAARKYAWGYVEEEPEETDNPPTKLKNAKWIQIIQPVFDFLGTVPGYREKDVSMYFLLFFTVFVAMIIGDAGYGLIFLLLALFLTFKTKKSGKKLPRFITLLYVLSLTTLAWGALTGTWFGSMAIANLPFFKSMIVPQITSFPELFPDLSVNPQDRVMLICFVLAVIQLGLASIINLIENLPQLKAFEHLGWFSLTVGLFTLVLNLVLGMNLPAFAMWLIGGGFLFILLFGKQEKGKPFFKGILAGLGGAFNTFLDAISSFSNIISYIRLFAVGMATVAIASSFNDIAAPMMQGPAIIAAALILLIGHGLNIIMGLLSVIVHGIRLNMLEFSGQLGLEWTGYKYEPFDDK
ncbi:MAG: V-type ATPase 116kDa subunit family protein [Candidatus Neomarinimicrobiota bacterium]